MGLAEDLLNTNIVDTLWTQLVDWPAFWAQDHDAEEWIAWPLIPAHRQVALFAPAKSGKSWITLAVCAAIATGSDILGQRNTAGPRHVLYLDYEMTEADLHERLESLGYGPDDDLSHLHYALLPSLPPLNTNEGCTALCMLAAAVDAEVVVIDTMGRAVAGEENSADSYREFAQTTGIALKQAGRAVLRTDHAGKNKELGQRGSSAKNDDVDVVMRIDLVEDGVTITRTHSRVAWVPEKVMVRRSENHDGLVTLTIDDQSRPYAEGTRELVDLMRSVGIDASWTVNNALRQLQAADRGTRKKRVADALRWMRAELPAFGLGSGTASGTTPNEQSGNHQPEPPRNPSGPATGTSGNHSRTQVGTGTPLIEGTDPSVDPELPSEEPLDLSEAIF